MIHVKYTPVECITTDSLSPLLPLKRKLWIPPPLPTRSSFHYTPIPPATAYAQTTTTAAAAIPITVPLPTPTDKPSFLFPDPPLIPGPPLVPATPPTAAELFFDPDPPPPPPLPPPPPPPPFPITPHAKSTSRRMKSNRCCGIVIFMAVVDVLVLVVVVGGVVACSWSLCISFVGARWTKNAGGRGM